MLTITTNSVYGRSDWFQASATVGGKIYTVFMTTRQGALMDILRQLAVKGYLHF